MIRRETLSGSSGFLFGVTEPMDTFATDIDKIPPLTRTKDWAEARRYITQGLSRWASDQMDHDEFLAMVARQLHRKLGRPVAPASARTGIE